MHPRFPYKFSFLLVLLFNFLITPAISQVSSTEARQQFQVKDSAIWQALQAQSEFATLTSEVKEQLYWISFVRIYPRKFYDEYAAPYIKQKYGSGNRYTSSLREDLYQAPSQQPLKLQSVLLKSSAAHAADLVRTKKFQHESSDGTSFQTRMTKLGFQCSGENIHLGTTTPFEALMSLLIDNKVKGTGHRNNLLSARFTHIGLAWVPYRDGMILLVEDFSCSR